MPRIHFHLAAGALCLGLAAFFASSAAVSAGDEKLPTPLEASKEKLKVLEADYRKALTEAVKEADGIEKKLDEELKKLSDDIYKEKDKDKRKDIKAALDVATAKKAKIHEFHTTYGGQLHEFRRVFGWDRVEDRLGAVVIAPSTILIDQLNLPKDEGKVVVQVPAKTLAAKVGLKSNDILLKIAGSPVPSESGPYMKFVNDIKTDGVVEVTVLRQGKQQTLSSATPAVTEPAVKDAPKKDTTPKKGT